MCVLKGVADVLTVPHVTRCVTVSVSQYREVLFPFGSLGRFEAVDKLEQLK